MNFSDQLKRAHPYLLLSAYGVFLCSYFIFDDWSDPYRVFTRLVFVIGIVVIWGGITAIWKQPIFQVIVIYMAYLLLSAFWSDPFEWFRFGQKVSIAGYLLGFIAITHHLVQWNTRLYTRMLQACVLFASLSALVSIIVFYRQQPFPVARLEGIGALTNVNLFANTYGIFALLAMGFALRTQSTTYRLLCLLSIGIFLSFAWFGQSRTAFVSMLLALAIMAGLTLKQHRVLYVLILALMAGALFILFPSVVEQAILRGHGLRPLIWSDAWDQAITAPILGHGLISEISIASGQHVFATLHNAYLQVFWEGGVIGLGLFLLLLAVAFRNAWALGRQQRDYTIFCMLLFTGCLMMTGVDTLIDRPKDQWMLFWLPMALLLSYPVQTPNPQAT